MNMNDYYDEDGCMRGCIKHGVCQGCQIDELEDRLKDLKRIATDLLETVNDEERTARRTSSNPGSSNPS